MAEAYCSNQRCGARLIKEEIALGKGRCMVCIIKGYKWALATMHKEIEELEEKNETLERALKKAEESTKLRKKS